MDFLNNINLSKNELQNGVIHKLAAAPANPVDGQVYYDTGDDLLYVRSGGAWVNALSQGDVTGITSGTPDSLSVASATGPVPSISIVTDTIAAGSNALATGDQIVNYVASISSGVTSVGTGDSNTISIGGSASAPTVATVTAAIADGGVNLATGDQIHTFVTDFGYTTNVGTVTSVAAGTGITLTGTATVNPTIALRYASGSNYILAGGGATTAAGEDLIAFSDADENVKKTALENIPMAALGAVKTYVDTAVAGASSFQGGYDASTNDPNLEAPTAGDVLQGFQWNVTADGLFFTEQVRVGDLLIANSDNPSALSDWTTVQSNIDLASTTVAGIASFSSDNFAVSAAGVVTVKDDGIALGAETTGNYVATVSTGDGLSNTTGTGEGSSPTVSLDFTELSQEAGLEFVMVADGVAVPKRASASQAAELLNAETSYAATITATAIVTHNLGTKDVIVQLYDTTTNDTVFADVDRTAANTITVTFAATPTNSIRVLVQKIG